MEAALQPRSVKPDALAIIEEGAPKSQLPNPTIKLDSANVQPVSAPKPAEPQRPVKPKNDKAKEMEDVAIVSATFRLPANLPPALLKASSERKLKKIQPFTQQDIVTEALTEWLKKTGYLN